MRRHVPDFVALAFGLIFVWFGGALLGGFEVSDFNPALVAAWTLGVMGILLAGVALNRAGRPNRKSEAEAETGPLQSG